MRRYLTLLFLTLGCGVAELRAGDGRELSDASHDVLINAGSFEVAGSESARDSLRSDRRDTMRRRLPRFLTLKMSGGKVLPTKDFISGENKISLYKAASLKFGVSSLGDKWQDIAYGMPYYGIGIYAADFSRGKDIGRPVSVYLFQGATITQLSGRLLLNYEWNLGASAGWKPYDPLDNPLNECISTDVNVHVGLNLYLKWIITRHLDMHVGVDATHFSNGASRMPNAGLNMASVFMEASYNFNRKNAVKSYNPNLLPPKYDPHYISEFLVNISSRQETVDTVGTGLPSKYIDRKFKVLGFNYAFMRVPNHRYRYGLSADLVYDESSGVTARRTTIDGRQYDIVSRGSVGERFSFGLSARGEMVLPGYSIFANLGYNIVNGNKDDHRFYQVIAVKVYLKDNFFGTFGIRANYFSRAQFLFWSLGYTLDHAPIERRFKRPR